MAEPQLALDDTNPSLNPESITDNTNTPVEGEQSPALKEVESAPSETEDTLEASGPTETAEVTPEPDTTTVDETPSPTPEAEERIRKWHFQPEIHLTISDQKIPMLLNAQTGELEAASPLRMDSDTLVSFVKGISDGELQELENALQALGKFVAIANYSVTAFTVAPTGEIHFNIEAHPESPAEAVETAIAFDAIRFTVAKEVQ